MSEHDKVSDTDDGTQLLKAYTTALATLIEVTMQSGYAIDNNRERGAKDAGHAVQDAHDVLEMRIYELCQALDYTRTQWRAAEEKLDDVERERDDAIKEALDRKRERETADAERLDEGRAIAGDA